MRQQITHSLILLLCLICNPAFTQTNALTVKLKETPHREPLNVHNGQTLIQLCGLTEGNTYQVIALGAFPDQKADFYLHLASPEAESIAKSKSRADRPELRRFKATATCMDLLLDAQNGGDLVPMSLSIGCLDCPESGDWSKRFLQNIPDGPPPTNLVTTQGETPNDLVTKVLVGGNCFDVSNISGKGSANSRGTFSSGQSSINIANGVVLCTAPVNILPGPNNVGNTNGGFSTDSPNDPNISTLTTGNQYDVSTIEFDFRPTANMVQFDFVFGSEEYCEFVNTQYNDAFGFFISGPGIAGVKNLAVIPNTNIPVAVNNINHALNSNYYRNNNNFSDCETEPVFNINDIQLDGFTKVLTATAILVPCQTYHIKLAIADIADANYTSAVFLRANSFDAGGEVRASPVYPSSEPYTVEGCNNGFIRFFRGSGDINLPLPVTYKIAPGNTATPGVDFSPIPTSITIPAGQSEILVPVNVIQDQIPEGAESFTLLLDNACSCQQQNVTFEIHDKVPLDIDMADQKVCTGSATLTPVLLSGGLPPLTYSWSSGQTTPTIQVSSIGSLPYTVTVTDVCGLTTTVSATATVDQTPTAILSAGNYQLCPGASISVPVTFTGFGPWVVGLNANGVQTTQTFSTNPGSLTLNAGGTYTLNSVVSQFGCPGLAGGTATAQEIAVSVNLIKQDPLCFGQKGSIKAEVISNFPPFTYVWNNGSAGPNRSDLGPGLYLVTVTTPQGCTATASTNLIEPPLLAAQVTQFNNIDCYRPVSNVNLSVSGGTPGYVYLWNNGNSALDPALTTGGIYTVTVTDMHQCSASTSITVLQNTTLPTVIANASREINCITPEVQLSSTGSSSGVEFVYTWSTPNGHLLGAPTESDPMVDAPGSYILLITNTANGCTASAQTEVTENTNYPTDLKLLVAQPGCNQAPGAINVMSVQGGEEPFMFSIDSGATFLAHSGFPGLLPGSYTVVVQDANGCEFEKTVSLVAPIEPDVSLDPEVRINYGDSTLLTAVLNVPLDGLDSIIWNPLSGLHLTSRPDQVWARPFKATRYTVRVISKNGCEDRAEVLVRVGDPDIYVPNVFNPYHANGENDRFTLYARDLVIRNVMHLQIFDRWGTQVYGKDNFLPNDDQTGGWDGRFRGRLLPPGVFTWWAEVELASGEQVHLKGDVTITD